MENGLFKAFDFFLSAYNEQQKQAITSVASPILCVAGAGSGKTLVLTKRIEFLIRFRSVRPEQILAITFTRKAREEMEKRLHSTGIDGVHVETFNSFCEKTLQQHHDAAYGREMSVLSYRDKIELMHEALNKDGKTMQEALELYYSGVQKKGDDELAHGFMNDCFTVLEYYKSEGKALEDFYLHDGLSVREKASAKMVHAACSEIMRLMKEKGFRDYTDQLLHALRFFEHHKEHIPSYKHVLVDEYQDVNSAQIRLIELLTWDNLFCVGDPRQSIFGWRGSKIHYILGFQKKYPHSEIITLVKNYRSASPIVGLINAAVVHMGLPALEPDVDCSGKACLISLSSEIEEYTYVVEQIMKSDIKRDDIFVLARTNRQLEELSAYMKLRGVKHIIRTDDHLAALKEGHVLLSTIHAIKGMEAELVFVVGCNHQNFPCKVGDHPILDLVKKVDYNKQEEERRLFYVALSRAKKELHLTTANGVTKFITPEMEKLLDVRVSRVQQPDAFERLREWRREKSERLGVPPYMVFHDSVLLDIAIRKPETLDELEQVKGIGPTNPFGLKLFQAVTERYEREKLKEKVTLDSPALVAKY
ncbi:UvrD-helicase domain-containing protein, partial [Candidatus Woesearchaeota archaeon]|nr:UvrD-helicase domain-containing protein [Candidatus Woesearchaeota archaeon]